ncbi:MAG: hypothetical protein R2836_06555 [Chitinophagales bacterium]
MMKFILIGNSNLSKMPKTSGTFNGDFDTYYAIFNTNTDLQLLIDTITPKHTNCMQKRNGRKINRKCKCKY